MPFSKLTSRSPSEAISEGGQEMSLSKLEPYIAIPRGPLAKISWMELVREWCGKII